MSLYFSPSLLRIDFKSFLLIGFSISGNLAILKKKKNHKCSLPRLCFLQEVSVESGGKARSCARVCPGGLSAWGEAGFAVTHTDCESWS